MVELLHRCIELDEPDAWGDFFLLVEKHASQRIRPILKMNGFSAMECEDVVQDIFVHLMDRNCQNLRAFRGHALPQLVCWIKTVAAYQTLKWIRTRCVDARRRIDAPDLDIADAAGFTEAEINVMLEEISQLSSDQAVKRLKIVMGRSQSEQEYSGRTYQRWEAKLIDLLCEVATFLA